MDEFGLIQKYWQNASNARTDVRLGIGDDAAIVTPPSGYELAITTDAALMGVHFFQDSSPAVIARRAFMRTLSDLAAMGARPAWLLMNLTMPKADEAWLQAFQTTLSNLLALYDMQLIGGDMSQGPLAVHMTAIGFLSKGHGLQRGGAQLNDLIVVSGELGGSHAYLVSKNEALADYYQQPTARIELGEALLPFAHACIDISDGLTQDLQHLLAKTAWGACLYLADIPCAKGASLESALHGGDDYELCFTVSATDFSKIVTTTPLTVIGRIETQPGLRAQSIHGEVMPLLIKGYQHYHE